MILEYRDKDGNPIQHVPIVYGTERGIGRFHPPFAFQTPAFYWDAPVSPGQSVSIAGVSSGLRVASCAVTAQITFLQLSGTDGNTQTFASPDWHLEARPHIVPQVSKNFPSLVLTPPASLLATVKIDKSGRVTDVTTTDVRDPKLVAWFSNWMRKDWNFHPALIGGHPVNSELPVLLRVYHSTEGNDFVGSEATPAAAIIQIAPQFNGSAGSLVYYSGSIQGSTI